MGGQGRNVIVPNKVGAMAAGEGIVEAVQRHDR